MQNGKEFRYTIIIEPCEDGGFFAMCPAFPGCHVQSDTYEETINEMRSSIKSFIEDYIEENETLPEDDLTITSLKVAV